MEKKLDLKLRINESAKYFSMSIREFEKKCNINRGTLGNIRPNQTINSDVLSRIIETFPQINIVWVITGKGKMILNTSEIEENTVEEEKIEYGKKDIVAEYLIKRISDLEKEVEDLKGKSTQLINQKPTAS